MSAPRSPDLDGIPCPNKVLYFLSALSNLLVQFLFGLASQVWPTKLHMHADWTIVKRENVVYRDDFLFDFPILVEAFNFKGLSSSHDVFYALCTLQ